MSAESPISPTVSSLALIYIRSLGNKADLYKENE
jgi:hypothetical protein